MALAHATPVNAASSGGLKFPDKTCPSQCASTGVCGGNPTPARKHDDGVKHATAAQVTGADESSPVNGVATPADATPPNTHTTTPARPRTFPCGSSAGAPFSFITFANSVQQVTIAAGPCIGVTNGVLFAYPTSNWSGEEAGM
ncbi:MAG: hypothetical protein ACLPVY_14070 [Acidimicrobiia bacterium]